MELQVKYVRPMGCVFLGKGIVDRPEMGIVTECAEVIFDTFDVMRQVWTDAHEEKKIVYKTDNGFVFCEDELESGYYEIEEYAPNWRAKKPPVFY